MLLTKNTRFVRFKKNTWSPKRGSKDHNIRELVARYGNGPFPVVLEQDNSITILTMTGSRLFPESCFEDVAGVAVSAD